MTLNAKALEAARKRLQENLDSFDKEIAYQISTEGERADLWTEIDVNADDLRTVLSSLPHVGVSEEALESVKHAIIISMQGYDYGREELDEDIGPVFRTTSQQIALIEERAEIAAKRVIAALSRQQEEAGRPCTCHPDDNPPNPCARRYALSECQHEEAVPVGWRYRYNGALYVTASEEQARQGFDVTSLYASPIASPAGEPGIKATAESIARIISQSYGEDPDGLAPRARICGPQNERLPNWMVYEEQANAIRSALVPAAPTPVSAPVGVVWEPISTADKGIAVDMTVGIVRMLHTYPIWARTEGGEPREVSWCQRKPDAPDGYWGDWDAEDVCDPDEWCPHPLSLRSPAVEG